MKRSRFRKWGKWVGLVGCVVIVTVFAVSVCWRLGRVFRCGSQTVMLAVGHGCLMVGHDDKPTVSEWWVERSRPQAPRVYWMPDYSRGSWLMLSATIIPLWIPFLIVAIPTLLLWRRDRRPPANHCQSCGYNLTGNVSGVCPECGTERLTTKA